MNRKQRGVMAGVEDKKQCAHDVVKISQKKNEKLKQALEPCALEIMDLYWKTSKISQTFYIRVYI